MCRGQGGRTLEPNAALEQDLGRTESLGSQRGSGGGTPSEIGAPAETVTPRRGAVPDLERHVYESAAGHGSDRGLLMLHEVRTATRC